MPWVDLYINQAIENNELFSSFDSQEGHLPSHPGMPRTCLKYFAQSNFYLKNCAQSNHVFVHISKCLFLLLLGLCMGQQRWYGMKTSSLPYFCLQIFLTPPAQEGVLQLKPSHFATFKFEMLINAHFENFKFRIPSLDLFLVCS